MGGVFADSERLRPAREKASAAGQSRFFWEFGSEDRDGKKGIVFTCPVSAIPAWVWDMFDLWWQSRMMSALPKPGGVLDQPVAVRRSFPVFEAEHRAREAQDGIHGSALSMAAVFGKMFSGGGRKV